MAELSGNVVGAAAGLHGFDANSVISAPVAAAFFSQGFRFCIRYIGRSTPQAGGDLSNKEAQRILDAGLALMPVQHVPKAGWTPSGSLGTEYGKAAALNSTAVGFPRGVNVWLDLEGVKAGVAPEEVIAYCNAWFNEVAGAGFAPGIYVGASCILGSDELFWRLRTKHYWRSGSKVPSIPQRGYQLTQRITTSPDTVNGIGIDRDVTVTDGFGDTVMWLVK